MKKKQIKFQQKFFKDTYSDTEFDFSKPFKKLKLNEIGNSDIFFTNI